MTSKQFLRIRCALALAFRRLRVAGLLLVVPALLSGCASAPKVGGSPGIRVLPASSLPAPESAARPTEIRPYFVGPFDKLTIDVFGIPELSKREVQVDAAGKVSFPLVGIVDVAGKTPGEVEQLFASALRQNYVRDPQVTVNLAQMVSQLLTVEGQVTRPGLYPVVGQMSLLQAMALSGGTTEFSKLNDVVIFRTVRGEKLAALYDLQAIRHGRYGDPEVFANDIIVVGDNKARRLFKDILQVAPLLMSPLIIAVQ